jgi:hypothetical protein
MKSWRSLFSARWSFTTDRVHLFLVSFGSRRSISWRESYRNLIAIAVAIIDVTEFAAGRGVGSCVRTQRTGGHLRVRELIRIDFGSPGCPKERSRKFQLR